MTSQLQPISGLDPLLSIEDLAEYLGLLVFLFFWNAAKFAWMAVLSPILVFRNALVGRAPSSMPTAALAGEFA